jgi:hypothetical protein
LKRGAQHRRQLFVFTGQQPGYCVGDADGFEGFQAETMRLVFYPDFANAQSFRKPWQALQRRWRVAGQTEMPAVHAITLLPGKLIGFNPSYVLSAGIFDKADLIGFCHHDMDIFPDPIPSIKAVIAIDNPNLLL